MNTILRRIINLNNKTKPLLQINILNPHPRFLNSTTTSPTEENEEKTAETITTLCKSFPKNLNWKTLNQKLNFITLNNPTLINKVLIHLKHPENAKKALSFFHWSAHFTKTTHQTHTYALLIHILVNGKLIKDANALIQSVLIRCTSSCDVMLFIRDLISSYDVTDSSVFVFDLTLQICAKMRLIDESIDICFCLGEHGFRLSLISYNVLLHVIQKSDKYKMVWRVYECMMDYKTYPNEKSFEIMVDALCKEGKLQSFVDMVDRIDGKRCLPRTIVNTCLVYGMINEGRVEDGLVLLKRLLIKNMISDSISCSLIVYGKIKAGRLESAREVFDEMLERGFNGNLFVYTKFVGAYCEAGKIEEGDELFKEMESIGLKAYDETYTHIMVGFSKAGRFVESLELCMKMVQKGFVPSCLAFNEVVERLNGHGNVCRANELLTVLLDKGFVPDVNTYSYLIAGYGREADVEGVLKLYYEMEYRKLSPGLLVFTWLTISLYQAGRLEESGKYLSIMKARSLVPLDCTYDMLIGNLNPRVIC